MTDPTLVAAIVAQAARTYHDTSYAYLLGAGAVFLIIVVAIGYWWRSRD